jgi:hypothetical protein
MKPPLNSKIDPANIYLQARGFFEAYSILSNDEKLKADPAAMVSVGNAAMVLSAFTSELLLKCLLCIEAGTAPRDHHLKRLFDALTPKLRERIEFLWDSTVVAVRAPQWDSIDSRITEKIERNLPRALERGSLAFERLRYSYEGGEALDIRWSLGDLPTVLGTTVLELKPDWAGLRLTYRELPTSPIR